MSHFVEMFHFDSQQLSALAEAHREGYAAAQPFPHVVFDDFLPEGVPDQVLAEFPAPDDEAWWRFQTDNERKLANSVDSRMGDATRHLLAELNGAVFIDFLAELTQINGLVPDPHFAGGGLHQSTRGGHLNVHVDFNRHPFTGLDRRLNALIYLNRDWDEAYGGALQLWSRDMKRCERKIYPVFNRMVVFSTTEYSYHGHPEPLACPEDVTRRSLALYYYSNGRPEESRRAADTHSTLWASPGQLPAAQNGSRVKRVVKQWAPPVIYDAARSARRRSRS